MCIKFPFCLPYKCSDTNLGELLRVLRVIMLVLLSHFSRVQLCDPMNYSPPGSSVSGILQARILEWVTTPFSKGSS